MIQYAGPMIRVNGQGEWQPLPPVLTALELCGVLKLPATDEAQAEEQASKLRRVGCPAKCFGKGKVVQHRYPADLVLEWVRRTSKGAHK